MDDLVTGLDDALSWRSQALGEQIARRAVEIIANDLSVMVGVVGERLGDRASADALLAELDALPVESYLRIVIAPETSRRLYAARKDPSQAFLDLVRSWCLAERLRLDASLPVERAVWTALGDAWWTPAAHEAPRVADRIVADFESPWRYRSPSVVADPREDWSADAPFTADERQALLDAITAAVQRIGGVSPEAQAFIANLTRVIVVLARRDPDRPFSSQSQRSVPGRTTLVFDRSFVRGELLDHDVAMIADSLIHEAIHSGIYWLEIDEPLFVDDGPDDALRLQSPWTGRPLPPQTFVHACFVWAGLRRFWSRPAAAVLFGAAAAEHHLARASVDGAAVRTVLEPISHHLNPKLHRALELLSP